MLSELLQSRLGIEESTLIQSVSVVSIDSSGLVDVPAAPGSHAVFLRLSWTLRLF